jgi:hypothetical protein
MRKKHWIIPDRNEEQKAVELQYEMSWRAKAIYINYPEDTKDPAGILQKYSLKKLKELVELAKGE